MWIYGSIRVVGGCESKGERPESLPVTGLGGLERGAKDGGRKRAEVPLGQLVFSAFRLRYMDEETDLDLSVLVRRWIA